MMNLTSSTPFGRKSPIDPYDVASSRKSYNAMFSPRLSVNLRKSVYMHTNDPKVEESKFKLEVHIIIVLMLMKDAI